MPIENVRRARRSLGALLACAGLSLACEPRGVSTEAPEDAAPEDAASEAGASGAPATGEPAAQEHHGHGGGHDVNEQGYKGHHRFDDPAQWAERFESAERAAWQKPDELVASLDVAADAKIADVGAGTGYFAVRLAAAAPRGQVFAVDIEPEMVAWLAERAQREGLSNMRAIQGRAEAPDLPEAVDLVFMCNVFHHLADPQAYFEAVAAQLEPGARVVIVDFRKDNPEDAPGPPIAMRMGAGEISALMEAAGYRPAGREDALLPYQYVLTFERGSSGD